MLLTLLGLVPSLAGLFSSYLTVKANSEIETERIKANYLLGLAHAKLAGNANDNQYLLLRLPKGMLFFSVSFYVSIIFIASALGIDTKDFAVQHIPQDLDYIPYALIGYWTLKEFT